MNGSAVAPSNVKRTFESAHFSRTIEVGMRKGGRRIEFRHEIDWGTNEEHAR